MNNPGDSDFITLEQEYNAAVAACPGIDPYCCRTDWILPFHSAFTPDSPFFFRSHSESFLVLAQSQAKKNIFSSVDSMWGFASALVGEQSPGLLGRACRDSLRQGHLILYGLPNDRAFLETVSRHSAATHRALLVNPVMRCVASLAGGMDGFWGRRTRKFRANARRGLKAAEQAGLVFRYTDRLGPEHLESFYGKILAVEAGSWKGLRGQGADEQPMRDFYRRMLERIGPAGRLRAIIAELDSRPMGYIYGAVVSGRFRGLQFSFDDRYRALSPGNVLQLKMLAWMSREGCREYDLGMRAAYKKNWAELEQATQTLYLRPLQ